MTEIKSESGGRVIVSGEILAIIAGKAALEVEGVTGKYFVKSAPKQSTSISHDENLQRELWDVCAQLVNLPAHETV